MIFVFVTKITIDDRPIRLAIYLVCFIFDKSFFELMTLIKVTDGRQNTFYIFEGCNCKGVGACMFMLGTCTVWSTLENKLSPQKKQVFGNNINGWPWTKPTTIMTPSS